MLAVFFVLYVSIQQTPSCKVYKHKEMSRKNRDFLREKSEFLRGISLCL